MQRRRLGEKHAETAMTWNNLVSNLAAQGRHAENLRGPLRHALWELRSRTADELVGERYEKFRRIGVFEESA